ncbi:GIN domain-containing protein, partial [Petrachloros mirabilis]
AVTLEGAGAYNSESLECNRATVTNNGAGAAIVRVSDELNATINGMGFIEYIGNPKVTRSVHGIGLVSQR